MRRGTILVLGVILVLGLAALPVYFNRRPASRPGSSATPGTAPDVSLSNPPMTVMSSRQVAEALARSYANPYTISEERRRELQDRLAARARDDLESLRLLLADPALDVRVKADVLRAIGPLRTAAARDILIGVFQSPSEAAVLRSTALGQLGEYRQFPEVFETLQSVYVADSGFAARDAILQTFARLQDPRAIPLLITETRPGNAAHLRRQATQSMGALGSDPRAWETLRRIALADDDRECRIQALESLWNVNRANAQAILQEIANRSEEDLKVQTYARVLMEKR